MFLSGFWNAFANAVRSVLPTLNTSHYTFKPRSASCSINLFSDGSCNCTNSDGVISADQWAILIATGVGASYWARITIAAGGDNPTAGPSPGTWNSLASTVTWTWTQPAGTGGERICSFTWDIASDSGGANIVGSGSGSADALEDIP